MNKKCTGAVLACALALGAWSGSALATPVNVGGVIFDPDSPMDLSIQALNFRETAVSQVGDVLKGYGLIGSINGTDANTFCPACDLTFTFQYTLQDVDTTGAQPRLVFDMGTLDFYVSAKGSFNVSDPTSVGSGPTWLSLAGHTASDSGYSTVGELYAVLNGTPGNPGNGSSGFGLLDVTGGMAGGYMDTNGRDDGADFTLNSSFQYFSDGACADGTCYPILGQGGLIGHSVNVPEPGVAGMLGLGLGLMGFLMWRRRKDDEVESESHA